VIEGAQEEPTVDGFGGKYIPQALKPALIIDTKRHD
jgi:hypothetical protein